MILQVTHYEDRMHASSQNDQGAPVLLERPWQDFLVHLRYQPGRGTGGQDNTKAVSTTTRVRKPLPSFRRHSKFNSEANLLSLLVVLDRVAVCQ